MSSEIVQMTNSDEHVVVPVNNSEANPTTAQQANLAPNNFCSPFYIFGFTLLIILLPLIFICFLIVALATLPLLLISLLIIRIFQSIKHGKSYKKLADFNNFVRGWLYINVIMVLIGLWIFFVFAKYIPSLNHVLVLDLPLTKWVIIISIVCGFYLLSYLIYSLTHGLTPMFNVRSLIFPQAVSEITDCAMIWFAEHEVRKRVPAIKEHRLLGLSTQKWIRVLILVLIGYNLITLFTYITILSLRKMCQQRKPDVDESGLWHRLFGKHLYIKQVVYFANGVKFSINFIMSSSLLLGTWVTYFGSRLDMNSAEAKRIWEFGIWTFLSLLICSFLWLVKNFVLLAWEAQTVYHRLESRIIPISEQLYFLGILGCKHSDVFNILPTTNVDAHQQTTTSPPGPPPPLDCRFFQYIFTNISREFREILSIRKWERITTHLLLPKEPTLDELQRAIKYFKDAKTHLLKETYISDFLTTYDPAADYWVNLRRILENHPPQPNSQGSNFMQLFNVNNQSPSEIEEVPNPSISQQNSSPICFNDYQKTWVKRAHNQCIFLANTLSSAKEVGGCLNRIISWLLIAATIFMWLLLTGLATTKVLILIASPLLAASFVFGNSCKTLFEGIIFVYVVHLLDVGDLCLIDGQMLEVIGIGIWTTTFTTVEKLGTQEVVRHPNLELAKKVITSHKTKFDWSDCLVYDLGNLSTTNIDNQKVVIEFFNNQLRMEDFPSISGSESLTISVTEDDKNNHCIKLVVCLEYKATEDTKFWTYSECLRRKEEIKADFCLHLHHAISLFKAEYQLEQSKSSTTTPTSSSIKPTSSMPTSSTTMPTSSTTVVD